MYFADASRSQIIDFGHMLMLVHVFVDQSVPKSHHRTARGTGHWVTQGTRVDGVAPTAGGAGRPQQRAV